jgi:glycosyltransferase involved in cell wall biosynthesis
MIEPRAGLPLVTAVIPVYNGERYLREAIDSVLAQDYPALDLLLIDDGSTDGSAAIARSCGARLRYHYQPNAGLSAAQNAGVENARGAFIAFLDCDDLWAPRKISRQLEVFEASPGTDLVFGHVRQFLSPDLEPGAGRAVPAGLEVMPGYSTGTLLARSEVFQRVGLFARDFRVGEFLEWYGRATDAGLRSQMLDEVLLHRRIHADNMGVRDRDQRGDYLKVFKAALDRRRRS